MHVIVIGLKILGATLLNLPTDIVGAAGGLMVLLPNSRNRSGCCIVLSCTVCLACLILRFHVLLQ